MYQASKLIAFATAPWTLLVSMLVALVFNPAVPPWDRAGIVALAPPLCWAVALVLVPLAGVAGTVLAIRAVRRKEARQWRGLCAAVANALVAAAYIPIWSVIVYPEPWGEMLAGRPRPSDAAGSLLIATPSPWTNGQYTGLSHFTADELNRTRHGADLRQLTYVPADVPSTGPLVISVNPIDDHA